MSAQNPFSFLSNLRYVSSDFGDIREFVTFLCTGEDFPKTLKKKFEGEALLRFYKKIDGVRSRLPPLQSRIRLKNFT